MPIICSCTRERGTSFTGWPNHNIYRKSCRALAGHFEEIRSSVSSFRLAGGWDFGLGTNREIAKVAVIGRSRRPGLCADIIRLPAAHDERHLPDLFSVAPRELVTGWGYSFVIDSSRLRRSRASVVMAASERSSAESPPAWEP